MRSLLAATVVALLVVPPVAGAQTPPSGGASPDDPRLSPDPSGGTRAGDELPVGDPPLKRPARRRSSRRSRSGRPVLSAFDVRPGVFFIYGRPARVQFRIDDRSRTVRVRLALVSARGKTVRAYSLGDRPTGVVQSFSINGREGGELPQGSYELRISARDPGGKRLSRAAKKSGIGRLAFYWHRFPLLGAFTYGGPDARFGAPRNGHSHQGQDLAAAEGTPVVAPRGGTVETVAYQAEGAGHYVVLGGNGEDRDYVFMHLKTGTIAVKQGERVRTGDLLGHVGNTGASFGAHLHFEVWEGGGWFSGGHPVDPLPYLKRWDAWS
jgi:murein DD-endopeptidase MepM/ murein hydrolase activator NlpD